ncbi:MAG: hypothetical protein Devi2KO_28490 [Devosia indica]
MIKKFTFATADKIFFTADTHFGHNSQAIRRGYDDLDEHDNELIHNWNREVPRDGIVFHLGDFAYKSTAEHRQRIFKRLNGRKYLILGNHDDSKTIELGWAAPPEHRMIVQIGAGEEQTTVVLDHYAGRCWYNSHNGHFQFYGHSHGDMPATTGACDVGVDPWCLQPITLADALTAINSADITMREVQDLIPGGPRCA